MGLVSSLASRITGNAGTGGWDDSSWRLTVEKYLSAPFLLAPFDFLLESSQVISCLPGCKPKEELPFRLYLKQHFFKSLSFCFSHTTKGPFLFM